MPGVPSGRGCNNCRKQKKKCDQVLPACGRCARLNLACIGSGQRRFKFVLANEESSTGSSGEEGTPTPAALPLRYSGTKWTITTLQNNENNSLVKSLISVIKPTTDVRYNIAWTYGDFFEDIPKRLGTSAALDSAVVTLLSAHSDLTTHQSQSSTRTLKSYGEALSTLRCSLSDPSKASATETLCATYLLLITQMFTGEGADCLTATHVQGAVQILKSWKPQDNTDAFERRLLLTLRGPVIFEGLFSTKANLTQEEWNLLLGSEWGSTGWENRFIQYLSEMPVYLRRGRDYKQGISDDETILCDIRSRYETMKHDLCRHRDRLTAFEQRDPKARKELAHLTFQRVYGLSLMVTLCLGCMVKALFPQDPDLVTEAAAMGQEVTLLADESHGYRPLGSSYILLCLIFAWAANEEPEGRKRVFEQIQDFAADFPWSGGSYYYEGMLERSVAHICMKDIPDMR